MSVDVTQFEAFRPALLGHCYRMLGSPFDADDAVQETMIRAWQAFDRFDGRASLKSWLYRIATNVCLDELKSRGRRARPMEEGPAGPGTPSIDELVKLPGSHWLEPIPDHEMCSHDASPEERAATRESIRLAFIAALQTLPPKQRAALLMSEVLDCPVAEVAEALETSIPSVNSALQRARATLAKLDTDNLSELTPPQKIMLGKYVAAFEGYDVTGLISLMQQEVTFCMPPYRLWLQGPQDVQTWMMGMGSGCRGSRLSPAPQACSWPAFAQYRPAPGGGYEAWALIVLELTGDRISGVNNFLDVQALFPRFGLPLQLSAN